MNNMAIGGQNPERVMQYAQQGQNFEQQILEREAMFKQMNQSWGASGILLDYCRELDEGFGEADADDDGLWVWSRPTAVLTIDRQDAINELAASSARASPSPTPNVPTVLERQAHVIGLALEKRIPDGQKLHRGHTLEGGLAEEHNE